MTRSFSIPTLLLALACSGCATIATNENPAVAPGCEDAQLTTPLFPLEAVDEDPAVVGGLPALQRRIRYPQAAKDSGISGQVWVDFAVNHEGCVVTAAAIETDIETDVRWFNEAAVAAIYRSRFEPAMKDGQAVATRHQLPITFRPPSR